MAPQKQRSVADLVWSGFYTKAQVIDIVRAGGRRQVDMAALHADVAAHWEHKQRAEKSWPKHTSCDRLDEAFAKLNQRAVLAVHNVGVGMAEGRVTVRRAYADAGGKDSGYDGFCFYHGQAVDSAMATGTLHVFCGAFHGAYAESQRVADLTTQAVIETGLLGSSEYLLVEVQLRWRRRSPR